MCAKRKVDGKLPTDPSANEQKTSELTQSAGQSSGVVEDYIWTAMQHYAAELRAGNKPGQRVTQQ